MTTVLDGGREPLVSSGAGAATDYIPEAGWYAETRPPFGSGSVALSIGRLEVRLTGLSEGQERRLRARFDPFVNATTPAGARPLTVRLTRAGRQGFLALPVNGGEIYRMGRRTSGNARDWWSYEFAGRVRPDERCAELALVASEGPLFDRGLENFLRAMTASFILDEGGLLLHAATVVRAGRAYVFFGPSGAGKTTITRLSPGDTVLSDDMTLVVPGPGGFEAAGIPFGMAHHHVPDTRDSFPIAGVHRLVQASVVERTPLRGATALAELTACLPYVCEHRDEATQSLENAGRLLEQVPAWKLYFRKDDSFWSVVQER